MLLNGLGYICCILLFAYTTDNSASSSLDSFQIFAVTNIAAIKPTGTYLYDSLGASVRVEAIEIKREKTKFLQRNDN